MSLEYRLVDQDRDVKVISRTYVWKDERADAPDLDASRVLEMYGTDESVDRHNTKLRVDGWDFNDYRKNPTFLWAHNMDPAVSMMPIGRIIAIQREEFSRADGASNKRLLFRIEFPERGTYPFADLVRDMYAQGQLRASSVGFRNLKMRRLNAEDDKDEMTKEGYDLKAGFAADLTHNALMELSAVPVGSNPNALAKALRGAPSLSEDVRALLDVNGDAEIDDAWITARFEALRVALTPEPPAPPKKDDGGAVFRDPVRDPAQHLPQNAKPEGGDAQSSAPVKRYGNTSSEALAYSEAHEAKAGKAMKGTEKHGADTIKGGHRAEEMDAHNQLAAMHKQHAGMLKEIDAASAKMARVDEHAPEYAAGKANVDQMRKAANAKAQEIDERENKLSRAISQLGSAHVGGEPHPELKNAPKWFRKLQASRAAAKADDAHRYEDVEHDADSHDELQQHFAKGVEFHAAAQKLHQGEADRKTAEAAKHTAMAKAAVAAGADREEIAKHVDNAQRAKFSAAHHDGKALHHEIEKKRHAGNAGEMDATHADDKKAVDVELIRVIEEWGNPSQEISNHVEERLATFAKLLEDIHRTLADGGAAKGGAPAAPAPAAPAPSPLDVLLTENLEGLERMRALFPTKRK